MDKQHVRSQFYQFFMKGFREDQIDEFLAKYNKSPIQFFEFLQAKQAEQRHCESLNTSIQESNLTETGSMSSRSTKSRMTPKQHKCNHCQRLFSKKRYYLAHLLIHSTKWLTRNFRDKMVLKSLQNARMRKFNVSKSRKHKCSQCRSSFYTKGNLLQHHLTHFGVKLFKCKECHRSFRTKYSLALHTVFHRGEKIFKCDCGRSFYKKTNLINHMRTHSEEKRFKCEKCNKLFTYKANLLTHMRTHNSVKSFVCTKCDKSFFTNSNLVSHLRTHKKDKIFK